MSEESLQLLSTELPGDQRAPQAVRRALEALHLPALPSDVLLVASELVTNAVRHSGCSPDELIWVRACTDGTRLTVSVQDPGRSGLSAHVQVLDDESADGFGLRLVDRLSTRWGADRESGYRVWAEMALAAAPSH